MTHELIEQKETKLIQVGGSKAIVIPSTWLERLKLNEESIIRLRLAKGKHGIFVDAYQIKKR